MAAAAAAAELNPIMLEFLLLLLFVCLSLSLSPSSVAASEGSLTHSLTRCGSSSASQWFMTAIDCNRAEAEAKRGEETREGGAKPEPPIERAYVSICFPANKRVQKTREEEGGGGGGGGSRRSGSG